MNKCNLCRLDRLFHTPLYTIIITTAAYIIKRTQSYVYNCITIKCIKSEYKDVLESNAGCVRKALLINRTGVIKSSAACGKKGLAH